jgi:hypothetical protein
VPETDDFEAVQPIPPGLDPDVARWLEMAEARAYLDTYVALGELPGDPLGARVAVIGAARPAWGGPHRRRHGAAGTEPPAARPLPPSGPPQSASRSEASSRRTGSEAA